MFRSGVPVGDEERRRCRDADDARVRHGIHPTVEVHERVVVRSEPRLLSPSEQEAEYDHFGFAIDYNEETGCFMPAYDFSHPEYVVDHATGLVWLKSLEGFMEWHEAAGYVVDLNQSRRAGFGDWRVPTLAELGTLFRSVIHYTTSRLDPRFGLRPLQIWSADSCEAYGGVGRWIYLAEEDGIAVRGGTNPATFSGSLLLVRGPVLEGFGLPP